MPSSCDGTPQDPVEGQIAVSGSFGAFTEHSSSSGAQRRGDQKMPYSPSAAGVQRTSCHLAVAAIAYDGADDSRLLKSTNSWAHTKVQREPFICPAQKP